MFFSCQKFFRNLFLLTIILFGIVFYNPSVSFASPEDISYFGITGQESSASNMTALGLSSIYSWSEGVNGSVNDNAHRTLNTIRLGSYWWGYDTVKQRGQNFFAASSDPNCNTSFTTLKTDGSSASVSYNWCAIDEKINFIYGGNGSSYTGIASQSPRYIVIGNEPNQTVTSQDSDGEVPSGFVQANYHAQQYKIIYDRIRALHPDVTIVGPSVVGFTMENGQTWWQDFINAYKGYNSNAVPPMDALNVHVYDTKVYTYGTTNLTTDFTVPFQRRLSVSAVTSELSSFNTWVQNNGYSGTTYQNKDVFITEFGVPNCGNANCVLNTASDVTTYLNGVINYFRQYKNSYHLKGWMLYSNRDNTSYPKNAVSLTTNATGTLTDMGSWYKKKAAQVFHDVSPVYITGSQTDERFDKIQQLFTKQVLSAVSGTYVKIDGCQSEAQTGLGLRAFCTTDIINRQDLSKFMIISLQNGTSSNANSFTGDVANNSPYVQYIEKMKARSITLGCGGAFYCPTNTLTRGAMVLFIGRSFGSTYWNFTLPTTASFSDIPYSQYDELYRAAEFAKSRGITFGMPGGCPPAPGNSFCSGNPVNRESMAIFLMRAYPLNQAY